MVLLGFKCFSSPGRARLWCCLVLIVSVPQGGGEAVVLLGFKCFRKGEAVVLLGFKCFSSPGRARVLLEAVSVPQGGRGCGVAWFKCFSSPGRARLWCCLGLNVSVPQGGRGCGVAWV